MTMSDAKMAERGAERQRGIHLLDSMIMMMVMMMMIGWSWTMTSSTTQATSPIVKIIIIIIIIIIINDFSVPLAKTMTGKVTINGYLQFRFSTFSSPWLLSWLILHLRCTWFQWLWGHPRLHPPTHSVPLISISHRSLYSLTNRNLAV